MLPWSSTPVSRRYTGVMLFLPVGAPALDRTQQKRGKDKYSDKAISKSRERRSIVKELERE